MRMRMRMIMMTDSLMKEDAKGWMVTGVEIRRRRRSDVYVSRLAGGYLYTKSLCL